MSKTITEQITDLQNENDRLKELQKLFEKGVKNEFGIDAKRIHKIINESTEKSSDFEAKICNYFGLKSNEDMKNFISVFCTESSLNYYKNKSSNDSVTDAEQQGRKCQNEQCE